MKQGILVIGPESSGTRLLTRVLIAGGCEGDGDHYQRFDHEGPPHESQCVVWRRSVPHDDRPLELSPMVQKLAEQNRQVTIVVIARHPVPTERSQTDTYTQDANTARFRIILAWKSIFSQLIFLHQAVDIVMFPYESLIAHPQESQRALWRRLQLPGGKPVEINDPNKQRYLQAASLN